ncbi:unnamed protein product [Amoebophrya sp. A120]|nr:unnamed protein product [Amoebophrya sp. A120]|eukprot:GSA120T00009211001.1
MDKIQEQKIAGAEHHLKKKVYRSQKPEKDDSVIDFSSHIHGDNAFHHTRTHNLNKPRDGKAPRSGYHRAEKMAAGYAKKLDVLPSEINKQVAEYENEKQLSPEMKDKVPEFLAGNEEDEKPGKLNSSGDSVSSIDSAPAVVIPKA